jgi:small GTP-binding protein
MRDQDDGSKIMKSVLIGDGAVGKTSMRRNYLGEEFIEGHLATIGVDLATKRLIFGDEVVKFVLWDLAGQPSFKQVRGHYYHGSNGIILVYSIIDRDSFYNASKWLVEAYRNLKKLPPTIIVGNKVDLRENPKYKDTVTTEEGIEFKELFEDRLSVPALFMETSAKTGENIQSAFSALLKMMEEEEEKKGEPELFRP